MIRSDKELLELAAKAAGEVGDYVENYSPGDYYADQFYSGNECGILTGSLGCYYVWNPLTDDGDAFRLAVKLGFAVRRISNKAMVSSSAGQFDEYCDRDPYAATRRAITRAAAEIGATL